MAILQLPVRSDLAAYSFAIQLELVRYQFNFRFNDRLGLWIMDVAKSDGTLVVAGIPVQTDVDLIGRFEYPDMPPGLLLAYDETGNSKDAGRNDLGESVTLLYQEAGS